MIAGNSGGEIVGRSPAVCVRQVDTINLPSRPISAIPQQFLRLCRSCLCRLAFLNDAVDHLRVIAKAIRWHAHPRSHARIRRHHGSEASPAGSTPPVAWRGCGAAYEARVPIWDVGRPVNVFTLNTSLRDRTVVRKSDVQTRSLPLHRSGIGKRG